MAILGSIPGAWECIWRFQAEATSGLYIFEIWISAKGGYPDSRFFGRGRTVLPPQRRRLRCGRLELRRSWKKGAATAIPAWFSASKPS